MNKYWQKTLQETVGKTVTGLSDSAARIKQGWADKPQTSPEPSSQSSSPRQLQPSPDKDKQQQYLRLPLESARKLRWYDREDLSNLVESNLKDKKLLQSTIAALRQVIQDSGISEAKLDEDLRERIEEVDKQAFYDEGVASVLLASQQGEIETLRAQLESSAAELALLKDRLMSTSESAGGESSHAANSKAVVLQIIVREDERPEASSQQAVIAHESNATLTLGSGHNAPIEMPASTDPMETQGVATEAPTPVHPKQNGIAGESPTAAVMKPLNPTKPDDDDREDAMAALLGKLRRVEEERREYFEEMARLNDLLATHERSAVESRDRLSELQAEVSAARKGWSDAEESAEVRLHDLRARVGASQTQHADMLRRAQDICIEAEERAAALEKRSEKAEIRLVKAEADLKETAAAVKRLTSDVKAREKERDRLEARAATAEGLLAEAKQKGELEKGGALSSALTAAKRSAEERESELRKAMREGEAKLRDRIERLETDNSELRRSLAKAEAEIGALDARVAGAEETESSLHRDLRAAEAAVADRDELEARIHALQDRLEETRAEQGQLAHYKQIAKELETERAKVEEEVIATVRIATSLESRLQAANTAKANAEHAASLAEKRAAEAERRIEREVARRLELISADESQWPQAARDALARQSQKLEAVHAMLAGLQNELDTEQHNLAAEQAARRDLQAKISAAEEALERMDREARDSVHRLEQKVTVLQAEVSEWQREAAAAEAEVTRLSASQRGKSAMFRAASASAPVSTPRRGSGALQGGFEDFQMQNGNGQPIDHLYLKNVLLKFIVSATEGNLGQCRVLLPAVATLLHATAQEYKALKGAIEGQSSWWPQGAAPS